NHVTSTFDDGAPAWATPRRQRLQPDHLYSSTLIRGIVKNQIPNVSADGRLSSRITPTASRSVSSADPHSWYLPPSGGAWRRQPVLPHHFIRSTASMRSTLPAA